MERLYYHTGPLNEAENDYEQSVYKPQPSHNKKTLPDCSDRGKYDGVIYHSIMIQARYTIWIAGTTLPSPLQRQPGGCGRHHRRPQRWVEGGRLVILIRHLFTGRSWLYNIPTILLCYCFCISSEGSVNVLLRRFSLPFVLLLSALLLTACTAKSDAATEQNPAATARLTHE